MNDIKIIEGLDPYIHKQDNDGQVYAVKNPEYWNRVTEYKYNILLKRSGIPKNYWDIEFEDYKGEKSIESKNRCVQYVENCFDEKFHNVSLYLQGNHGSQKSTCSCNIGKGFIRKGLKVSFIYASEMIDLLLKSQGFSYIKEIEEKIKKIVDVDLLIIDDIFDTEKGVYWKNSPELVISAWDKFLRRLLSEDVRIILNSNYPISVIKTKFRESIYQLIDRNFCELTFVDSIHGERKSRFGEIWE